MVDKLPNYSRADDPMVVAERFFRRAGAICERNSRASTDPVGGGFLEYAARGCADLADSFAEQQHGPDTGAQQTYRQYTPEDPLPGPEQLASIEQAGGAAQESLVALQNACQQWLRIFTQMRDNSAVQSERELHEACRQLVDARARALSTAFHRGADL